MKKWIPINRKENVTEEAVTEIVEEQEEKKEMGFLKRNVGKIAAGGALLLATAGGIFLATRNKDEESDLDFEPVDNDEVPFDQDGESEKDS